MSDYLEERNDGIVIRFAKTEDKEAIYEFALSAIAGTSLPEFAEDAGEHLQERIEQGNPENVLIAEDTNESGQIIGYIELDPTRTRKQDVVYIRGIYVLPDYRRRGIGNSMLRMVRRHSVSNQIQLRVEAFTEEGRKFWNNFGFKVHHYSMYHDGNL